MNTLLKEKSKRSAIRGYWIIAIVFAAMYLTACTGNVSTAPDLSNNNLPSIKLDRDLTQVVLGPGDVTDLFQGATYSITQAIMSPESQGIMVTYPTQFLAHTTAFEYGFSTRIEIFKNTDQAVKSYDGILTQQSGEALAIKPLGSASRAFVRKAMTPEGANLNSTEYAVLFREQNAVATIILRIDKSVSSDRLNQLTKLVVDRLQP